MNNHHRSYGRRTSRPLSTSKHHRPRQSPGLFCIRISPRISRAFHHSEPFRMTLEDAGWLSEPLRAGFPVRQGSSLKGNYRHDKTNRECLRHFCPC
nr:MAG TPA: hypothetical protein [Caudoviricetes sp.]